MKCLQALLLLGFVVILSLSFCSSTSINFEWGSPSVYGQKDVYSKSNKTIEGAEDFVLTNTSLILLNTYGMRTSRIIEFQLPNFTSYLFNSTGLLYSIVKRSSGFFIGSDNSLLQVSYNLSSFTAFPQPAFRFVLGLTMHQGLLYMSSNSRVVALKSSDLNASLILYGQPNMSTFSTPNTSPTLGFIPRKTAVDCSGSFLWVSDPFRGRVISYPIVNNGSSYIPHTVLGQQSDSTQTTNKDANTLVGPNGLAFSDDCSVMFVADSYRVVRYRAPYTTGQAAEGMLGFSSFSDNFYSPSTNSTPETTFNEIFAIAFRDYRNGTGKLYLLDRNNNRVIAGVTTTTALAIYPLYCNSANNITIQCNVQGNVIINNNQTLTLGEALHLQIQGSLTLSPQTIVNMSQQQVINTTGGVVFDGGLVLTIKGDTINSSIINSNNITLFLYKSSTGAFSSIEIKEEQSEKKGCRREGTAEYDSTSMRVIISTVCDEESEGVKRNVIIGVVVGVGGCCVIVVVVLVVVVIIVSIYSASSKRANGRVNF